MSVCACAAVTPRREGPSSRSLLWPEPCQTRNANRARTGAIPEAEAGGFQIHGQPLPDYMSQEIEALAAKPDMGSILGVTWWKGRTTSCPLTPHAHLHTCTYK